MFHLNEAHAESRVKCLVALGKAREPPLVTRYLDWAFNSGDVRNQDLMYALGALAANRHGRDLAWLYLQQHWAELMDRYKVCGGVVCVVIWPRKSPCTFRSIPSLVPSRVAS